MYENEVVSLTVVSTLCGYANTLPNRAERCLSALMPKSCRLTKAMTVNMIVLACLIKWQR